MKDPVSREPANRASLFAMQICICKFSNINEILQQTTSSYITDVSFW